MGDFSKSVFLWRGYTLEDRCLRGPVVLGGIVSLGVSLNSCLVTSAERPSRGISFWKSNLVILQIEYYLTHTSLFDEGSVVTTLCTDSCCTCRDLLCGCDLLLICRLEALFSLCCDLLLESYERVVNEWIEYNSLIYKHTTPLNPFIILSERK